MFRYVAVIWRPEECQIPRVQFIVSRLKAARWTESLHVQGMRVFHAGAARGRLDAHALPGAAGVVIGRAFQGRSDPLDDGVAQEWRVNDVDSQAIVASGGQWLIERCWGNYVALVRTSQARISIVKDPVGSLPCFLTSSDGVTLVFSYLDELVRLGLGRFTLNREYMRTRTIHGADLQGRPLNEIEQVRRGECAELDPGAGRPRSRRFLWHPQRFIENDEGFEDPDLAAQAIRASVRMSAHTLVARESRVVVRLSGGLDSSIVAGCLGDAPNRPELHCYTYFNPGAPSDERRWARLVAQRLHCTHEEVPIRPADFDLRLALDQPLQFEPTSVLAYTLRSVEQPIADRHDAAMVFNGDGGDSVFGAHAVRYAATEYVRRRGLRMDALPIASAVAQYTGESIWTVLRRVLATLLGRPDADPLSIRTDISRLIDGDAPNCAAPGEMSAHPWLAGSPGAMWSLVRRLGMLLASPVFYDTISSDGAPEVVSPLYSQQVVEALLRIPLYRLFEAGRDRGLARRAFVREVPEPILARLWKDRAPGYHEQVLFMNRKFLREALLDGVLVRDGLLDRRALEETFADQPSKSRARPAEILRHFDMEMWVRAWESAVPCSLPRRAGVNGV